MKEEGRKKKRCWNLGYKIGDEKENERKDG